MPWVGRVHYGDPTSFKGRVKRAWSRLTTKTGGGQIQPNTYMTDGAKATEPVWVNEYMTHLDQVLDKIKGV